MANGGREMVKWETADGERAIVDGEVIGNGRGIAHRLAGDR